MRLEDLNKEDDEEVEEDEDPKQVEGLGQGEESEGVVGGRGGVGEVSVVPPVYQPPPDWSGVVELQHVSRSVRPLLAQSERNLLRFMMVKEVTQTEEWNEKTYHGNDSGRRGEERYEDDQDFRGRFQVGFLNINCLHME